MREQLCRVRKHKIHPEHAKDAPCHGTEIRYLFCITPAANLDIHSSDICYDVCDQYKLNLSLSKFIILQKITKKS